jgi:hypothetical protein
MSLQYLGISHFPVLHRQFSSPRSSTFPESPPIQDLTQDNKDVLIERLNDLIIRLAKDSSIEDSTISAIHNGIDRIELILKNRKIGTHKKSPSFGSDIQAFKGGGEDAFWGPLSPTRNARIQFPDSESLPEREPSSPKLAHHFVIPEVRMSPDHAIEIAKSAEEVASRLSVTVAELQVRKEESDASFAEHFEATG